MSQLGQCPELVNCLPALCNLSKDRDYSLGMFDLLMHCHQAFVILIENNKQNTVYIIFNSQSASIQNVNNLYSNSAKEVSYCLITDWEVRLKLPSEFMAMLRFQLEPSCL